MSLDSLARIKTYSPLKVSTAFALGIILPSGFLGFLGLRSYQYEGRLMQKETEERYSAIADLVEKKVGDHLSEIQSALRSLANQSPVQNFDRAQMTTLLLKPPSLNHLPPDKLFVFDETDAMVAPWRDESSHTQESRRRDLEWGADTDEINRLEQLEFAQKDYANALHGYIALQAHRLTSVQQAVLLKNIAGDYRQLHQNNLAINTYLKLAQQYDQVMDFTGVPMGLIGRRTAIELYEGNGEWGNALDLRLDLLEGLLYRQWKMPSVQRKLLLSDDLRAIERLNANHPASASRQSRWRTLQSLYERLESLEREAEGFAKNTWPGLLQRIHRQGKYDQGAILQLTSTTPAPIVVIAPILAPERNHRRGYIVALFSANTVWASINTLLTEVARPVGLQVAWEHSPSGVNPDRRLWKAHLRRIVTRIDPPLHFEFINPTSVQDQAYHRRQWIFGGMIGISFLVIIVGLVFTSRAVKRETEVANLKADFVANVSHEIRTPLSVIYHIGETLKTRRYRSDAERDEIYDLLSDETGHLRELIEDILDFSKMLAGKKGYRKDPLDLIVLTLECVSTFEPKAESQGFSLTPTMPSQAVPILGDARALRQTILNLLDNALKYSGDARAIEIQVAKSNGTAVVTVTDHGIGIATADQEKIFEKFYRVKTAGDAPDAGGVGLGLAMVKHVVEGHGGKVDIKSKVGQGSSFSLIFPLAREGAI